MKSYHNDDAQSIALLIACFIIALIGLIIGELFNKYFFLNLVSDILNRISAFMPNTSIFSDNAEPIKMFARLALDLFFMCIPVVALIATQKGE